MARVRSPTWLRNFGVVVLTLFALLLIVVLAELRAQHQLQTSISEHCGFQAFFEKHSTGLGIHKWLHYFRVYEREFGRHCGAHGIKLRMLEIGVQSGGSIQMWLDRFGENIESFTGLDVDVATQEWTKIDDRVHIEIGSQTDPGILQDLSTKHPDGFDVILDDGSHLAEDMIQTFTYAFENILNPGGVYVVEDITQENVRFLSFIMHEYKYQQNTSLSLLEGLYHHEGDAPCCAFATNGIQQDIDYISLNPMIVAIRKRSMKVSLLQAPRRGDAWIP